MSDTHLDILDDELHGLPRRPFWSRHAIVETEYVKQMGAE